MWKSGSAILRTGGLIMGNAKFALVPAVILAVIFIWCVPAQAQQLNAPTNFDGTATGTTTIQWTWDDTNTSPNENGHRVFDTAGTPDTLDDTAVSVPDLPADSVSWDETNLTENTQFERYVKAVGGTGGEQLDETNHPASIVGGYVDQSYSWAHSFNPTISGDLTQIVLGLYRSASSLNPITIEIREDSGSGTTPSATVLASESGTIPSGTMMAITIPFSSPATVTAGNRYWIVLSCPDIATQGYQVAVSDGNTYDGANSVAILISSVWYNYDYDFWFDTYIDPGSSGVDSDVPPTVV